MIRPVVSADFGESTGSGENWRVGRYTDDAAQNLWRQAVTCVSVDGVIQPPSTEMVVARIRIGKREREH